MSLTRVQSLVDGTKMKKALREKNNGVSICAECDRAEVPGKNLHVVLDGVAYCRRCSVTKKGGFKIHIPAPSDYQCDSCGRERSTLNLVKTHLKDGTVKWRSQSFSCITKFPGKLFCRTCHRFYVTKKRLRTKAELKKIRKTKPRKSETYTTWAFDANYFGVACLHPTTLHSRTTPTLSSSITSSSSTRNG
jgi:hypothetical protein